MTAVEIAVPAEAQAQVQKAIGPGIKARIVGLHQTSIAKIKTLRKSRGLKQGEIPGLSERHVRRLESGEVYPHSSTLNKLAAAHDLPPAEYVRQLAALVSEAA